MRRRLAALGTVVAVACAGAVLAHRPRMVEMLGNPHVTERDERLYLDGEVFSGIAVERFPDGQVYRETHYTRGMKDGLSREFGITGALRAQWNYHAGKKHGAQVGWYIEGPKRFESNFKNGLLEGHQVEWHLNGAVFREQQFVDGIEVRNKILYSTAEIYSNYVKRDGRTFGIDGGALCFETKKEGER